MSTPRVVIVGGGLAGMSAAAALESAGARVTLLEARRHLGGRAGSFEDPQTGEMLDNCQHVLLGCCTNLIDFYRRLGVLERIRFHPAIHFRDERGRRYDLCGIRGLPAPLHLAGSFARFSALSWVDRRQLATAMFAMLRLGRAGRAHLADIPFGQWLDAHGQSPSLIRNFYDPILISALNEETRRASAMHAIAVFQDSLLTHSEGYLIGIPVCSLSRLYDRLPCRDVQLGARVHKLRFAGDRVTGVELQSGEIVDADAVVLATNFPSLAKWISEDLRRGDERFRLVEKFETVPILGAHLWFDRPVLRESHAALQRGPLQWIFRKDRSGSFVHGVISAARLWLDRSKDEMLKLFVMQIRTTLPEGRAANLVRGVIVIDKRATFSPLPGVDRFRPAQAPTAGGISNLFLAGDYTQTGWPATMEGAVRSGYLCAEAITGRRFLVDDLPVQWPARLLACL